MAISYSFSAVSVVLFLSILSGTVVQTTLSAADGKVYVLEYNISGNHKDYAMDCARNLLVGLASNDTKSLLIYDLGKSQFVSKRTLPLPALQVQFSGSKFVITHEAYISFLSGNDLRTHYVPIGDFSSSFSLGNLACLIPYTNLSASISCVDVNTGELSFFKINDTLRDMYGGVAYVDQNNKWVYIHGSNNVIFKLRLVGTHLQYVYMRNFAQSLDLLPWAVSYDSSRIFLRRGDTYTLSSDPRIDLQAHGSFEGYHAYKRGVRAISNDGPEYYPIGGYISIHSFRHISQSIKAPYTIAALDAQCSSVFCDREIPSDPITNVTYYNWPYLQHMSSKPIPSTPVAKLVNAKEIHVCDKSELTYVLATYIHGGVERFGVAYIHH